MDVQNTLSSGQVFLWKYVDKFWYGIDGQNVLKVNDTGIVGGSNTIPDFFRQNDDIKAIHTSLSQDRLIRNLIETYKDLRITKQDFFQCVISFIVSANSNIPRIRKNLQQICGRFGDAAKYDDMDFYTFPTPDILAASDIQDIKSCGVGYRAKYIQETSLHIQNDYDDYRHLDKMPYDMAQERLCTLSGVGRKVADCILLFSCGHLEAVPLDRWIVRVMHENYNIGDGNGPRTESQYTALHDDIVQRLGPYAGYAQQYLFKMARDNSEKPLKW